VPTTINTVTTPDGAYTISFGGEAEANYRAGVDSWHRTLAFLRRYL
jgi:hypothetical protein